MYKIIGADQKEYGPISTEQMRQWFSEGRVNAQTLVWSEASGNWKPLAQYPELSGIAPQPSLAPGGAIFGIDPAAARSEAMNKVSGPAIGLMVTAIFGFLSSFSTFMIKPFLQGLAASKPEFQQLADAMDMGVFGIFQMVFILGLSTLILIGGLKMKRLQSHGLCTAAAWVAIIPCISPCCVIGLPFGIWAVVVLNKPEVKSQFS